MDLVGQQRMSELHGGRRDKLEVYPNLWAGVGLVRGGAGTALWSAIPTVAERIDEYRRIGADTFMLLRLSASGGSLPGRRIAVPAFAAEEPGYVVRGPRQHRARSAKFSPAPDGKWRNLERKPQTIAIVGGGFSGAAIAYHLAQARAPAEILVFEPRAKLGGGACLRRRRPRSPHQRARFAHVAAAEGRRTFHALAAKDRTGRRRP